MKDIIQLIKLKLLDLFLSMIMSLQSLLSEIVKKTHKRIENLKGDSNG